MQMPFESETEEKSSQRFVLSFCCCCTLCMVANFTLVYFFNGEGFSYCVELSPSLLHHLGVLCVVIYLIHLLAPLLWSRLLSLPKNGAEAKPNQ